MYIYYISIGLRLNIGQILTNAKRSLHSDPKYNHLHNDGVN